MKRNKAGAADARRRRSSRPLFAADLSVRPRRRSNHAPGDAGDHALTAQVRTALQGEPSLRASHIHISTAWRVVHLSGVISSIEMHSVALAAAQAVPGVNRVCSTLRVAEAGGLPRL